MRTPRTLLALAAALGAVVVLTACAEQPTEPAPEPAAPAEDDPVEATATPLDRTFWYAGFMVELDRAVIEVDELDEATLRLEATFENLGPSGAVFPGAEVHVDWQGSVVQPRGYQADLPTVPAGSRSRGSLAFGVPEGFTIDDAELRAGDGTVQQAVVPLGEDGELRSGEPETTDVTGTLSAGDLEVEATGGELRAWGFPFGSDARQVRADALILAVTLDVTNATDSRYGANLTPDELRLELPDGTTAVPDNRPNELIRPGETVRDVVVEFIVADPAAGDYALTVAERRVGADDDAVGTLTFTIDG